jgi:hypothetical protein
MMGLVIISAIVSHYRLEWSQPKEEETTSVVTSVEGVIESVIGKNFEKKDSVIGRNLGDGRLSLLLDVLTAGPCRVQIRVEEKLVTIEPRYAVCQKAEKGQKVRLRKTTITHASDGEVTVSYRLLTA